MDLQCLGWLRLKRRFPVSVVAAKLPFFSVLPEKEGPS
jgi:hypothetical protein